MKTSFFVLVMFFFSVFRAHAQTGHAILRSQGPSLQATRDLAEASLDYFIAHAWNAKHETFVSDPATQAVFILDLSRLLYSLAYSPKPEHHYFAGKAKEFILTHMVRGGHFVEKVILTGDLLKVEPAEALTVNYQAYGLTGLVAYYDATKDRAVLLKIRELFANFVSKFHDKEGGGFFDTNMVLSPDPLPKTYTKSYNSTVYVATAFLFELCRIDSEHRNIYEPYLIELSDIVASKFLDPETGWIVENFTRDWRPSWRSWQSDEGKSVGIVGHNFQAAWMLMRASQLPGANGDKARSYRRAAKAILAQMLVKPAIDWENGGVYNAIIRETDSFKWGPTKHWWQQAEAIMGLSLALQIELFDGEELKKVGTALQKTTAFYLENFIDRVNGGVFPELAEDGTPMNPAQSKVKFGTGAYHEVELVRMVQRYLLEYATAMKISSDIAVISNNLPLVFEGRGRHKAAFLVFATPADVRSAAETIERYKILRERGVPTDGFYLEAEHTGLSPEGSRVFVALAEQNGFRVMVRPPSLAVDAVKAWNSLGHSGLIVPLVNSYADIDAGFRANHYALGRPIGYEIDTRFLTSGSPQDRARIDAHRTLAFMIEDYSAAENVEKLAAYAAKQAESFNIPAKRVAFWLGPYDMAADILRIKNREWSEARVQAYINERIPVIAAAVTKHGLTMAGHVPDGDVALARIRQGWSAFTYDGMFSAELFSPRSVSQRFGEDAGSFLSQVRQQPRYTAEERQQLQQLNSELSQLLGCSGGFR